MAFKREGVWALAIWRILIRHFWQSNYGVCSINPFLLWLGMLKEKYFKTGSLLEAKLGLNPFFIWRSLWSALDLVR